MDKRPLCEYKKLLCQHKKLSLKAVLIFAGIFGYLNIPQAQSSPEYSEEKLTKGYYIVLASRKEKDDAERAKEWISELVDFAVIVRDVEVRGDTWYRLTSPFYEKKSEVKAVFSNLHKSLSSDAWYFRTSIKSKNQAVQEVEIEVEPAVVQSAWANTGVKPMALDEQPVTDLDDQLAKTHVFGVLEPEVGESAAETVVAPKLSEISEKVLIAEVVAEGAEIVKDVKDLALPKEEQESRSSKADYPFRHFGRLNRKDNIDN